MEVPKSEEEGVGVLGGNWSRVRKEKPKGGKPNLAKKDKQKSACGKNRVRKFSKCFGRSPRSSFFFYLYAREKKKQRMRKKEMDKQRRSLLLKRKTKAYYRRVWCCDTSIGGGRKVWLWV